jgi:hypothetical protein
LELAVFLWVFCAPGGSGWGFNASFLSLSPPFACAKAKLAANITVTLTANNFFIASPYDYEEVSQPLGHQTRFAEISFQHLPVGKKHRFNWSFDREGGCRRISDNQSHLASGHWSPV